jgi:membrane protein YdbS with pleckstrin-like domain
MDFNWGGVVSPEEKILREFTISKRYYNTVLGLALIISCMTMVANIFAGAVILILGILYWYYLKRAKHYAFTDKRIIMIDSFVGMSATSVDYSQITDIEIDQSPVDQMLGWGNLVINTAGTHAPIISLPFLENPMTLKQELDKIRDTKH